MKRIDNSGVVALITTIIVGLLLIVITTSAVALMGSELRQATDYDQSVKAYYASESGVEDTIAVLRRARNAGKSYSQIISAKPGSAGGCDQYTNPVVFTPAVSPNPGVGISSTLSGQISYSCQIVTTSGNNVTGHLNAEAATTIDLNGTSPQPDKLRISWNKPGANSDPAGFNASTCPTSFTQGNAWKDGGGKACPAVMEISVISYPTSSFVSGNVTKDTVVFRPSSGGPGLTPYNFPSTAQPVTVNCTSGGEYNCSADINVAGIGSPRVLVVNLYARYSGATYKLEALNAPGTALDIPNAQLVIDVTGKAGDIYRRIQVKAPLNPQSGFPFFSILADDNICKVFGVLRVTDSASGSPTGCN